MSVYNEDELIAPSWIDEKFLENVLQKYENNQSLKIINCDISPASMKGDHYASIMFRCKTNYKIDGITDFKQKSLIIKTLPEVGMKAEMLQQSKVFETEIKMYTETLPKIEQILAQNGESTKLAANIIYHALEPQKVLIFDDLCELGYDILRTRYLTEEELKMIYRKVAKLHAVSYMLSQTEDHEIVTQYDEGIFSNSAMNSSDFMSKGILNFIDLLAKHEEFRPYLDKVKLMQPKMSKQCQNLYNAFKLNRDERNIFVLNHGDFHLKNLMFKFNNANVAEDLIMVDYQLSCFAPINIDLIYSLYMMMRPEFRLRRNEFLYYYFEEFLRVLKQIKYQGEMPKYSDFQMANLKYRYFVLFLISTLLPINHVVQSASEDELKEMNISDYIENSNTTVTLYDHPGYINELKQLLPSLLVDGYFD